MSQVIQEWIRNNCPEEWQSLSLEIRQCILKKYPQAQEQIKWKVPFFSHYSSLCYLNPKKDKLEVGFMKGVRLSDPEKKLSGGELKLIRHCVFTHDHQPWQDLEHFLEQAVFLNRWDSGK